MSLIRFAIAFFVFLWSFCFSHAQTKTITRLKDNVQAAKTADEKLQALLNLCDQGYNLHVDTLMYYAQ